MRVESGEIIKALRCSAKPMPLGTDILQYCHGCPYDTTEVPEKFAICMAEKDGLLHYCDVDQIATDAADIIKELEREIERKEGRSGEG